MTRVFVYEYMTATGLGRDPASPEHGMYLEGRAMRDALVEDLRRVPNVEAFAFPDEAAPIEPEWFEETCSSAVSDRTLVIAPETDEILVRLARLVEDEERRGRLLGSSPRAIELTSDKLAMAEHWWEHDVPTPATTDREPTPCEAFPVVWKPRDGAGSTDTFLIRNRFELAAALAARDPARPMTLQEFVPGRAASCAFLCGPNGNVPLVPTFQFLSDDGRFKYQGGELPIPADLAERAVRLASRAVACVPGLLGYVGVDLVLGDTADGACDFAIEINPRLTTSYIGLRAIADFNVAEAMLRIAAGEPVGQLKWKPGRVRFGPDGGVRWC
ncbi:MAG: ATP-grasp domain-containing protein [Planctomycetes bacterium]|nr:ATP-grasp domain-containing protein [Planctomycetota bacterium]